MTTVSKPPTNGIQRRTTDSWCVGADKIIEEAAGGKYNVIACRNLDLQDMRRLHAVLGHVLADIDGDQFSACNSVEQPAF